MTNILSILKNTKAENQISQPYIIAEIGVNHEGNLDTAKFLIKEAKEGGADAVKFQSYKAETLASQNSPAYWDLKKEPTTSQYELFKKYDTFGEQEMLILAKHAKELEIDFMSTPFDLTSANYLTNIMDVIKISSSDLNNKPFIQYLSSFKKPILLSTGASYLSEIKRTLSWIPNDIPVALLHCVLSYPTHDKDANLAVITSLKKEFPHLTIGYSDHTLPHNMHSCLLATILGATIIEKHFTHNKSLPGNDHYHAMDKDDLKLLRKHIDKTIELLGSPNIAPHACEKRSRIEARRSLVAKSNIPKGSYITTNNITFKRPSYGIAPSDIELLIGKKAKFNISEDSILTWDMFE